MEYEVHCHRIIKELGTFVVDADNPTEAYYKAKEYLHKTCDPIAWDDGIAAEDYGIDDIRPAGSEDKG